VRRAKFYLGGALERARREISRRLVAAYGGNVSPASGADEEGDHRRPGLGDLIAHAAAITGKPFADIIAHYSGPQLGLLFEQHDLISRRDTLRRLDSTYLAVTAAWIGGKHYDDMTRYRDKLTDQDTTANKPDAIEATARQQTALREAAGIPQPPIPPPPPI